MKYEAKVNFSGKISMCVGEVQDITDEAIAKDLLRAGYIVAVKPAAEVKTAKAKSDKKGANDEKNNSRRA